ncbi:MAG: efflux RND transporter periplasmic adaptor subunit [Planctomycetota bacterium]
MKSYSYTLSLIWVLLLLLACSEDHGGQEAHAGDEEAHGVVVLSESQAESAGISLETARPGRVSEVLTLPGSVASNADAVIHVTPRVAGQVRGVFKQLGEHVAPGDLLCVLDSVELGEAVADYLHDRAMVDSAEETLDRGRELFAKRLEALSTVLEGAITVQQRIRDREADLQERAVSTIRPLLEAEKSLELAKLERDERLVELEALRDTRLLELEVSLRARRIELAAAIDRLETLGVPESALESLTPDSKLGSGEYRVVAPGEGIIVDRHVSTGEFAMAGTKLFVLEDLSSVWFVASAFEEQLSRVRTGQSASVLLDAFPDTRLHGKVSFVDYHVDPVSRSVGVRITLDNEQLTSWPEEFPIRPGMFGRVALETDVRDAALVIPEEALLHGDLGDTVFVEIAPRTYERRWLRVRPAAEGRVEVLDGLSEGDRVVATGTFLLDSAERQGELGGGHDH